MPKSRASRRSSSSSRRSSSSSKKTTTRKRKEPMGVPMPAEHIKRIVDGEKKFYSKMGMSFENEHDIVALLSHLRFKKPNEPYSFWSKIYGWQDAVQKALPMQRM
jgi:hypothetical protein